MAERHREALARVRSDAERAEAAIERLQGDVSDQVERARLKRFSKSSSTQ